MIVSTANLKFKPVSITFTCETEKELQYIKDVFNPDSKLSSVVIPIDMVHNKVFTQVYSQIEKL